MGKNTSGPPGASDWIAVAQEYENRTRDPDGVSDYFRTKGLYPGIERIVGDCSSKVVLDAGCRDDWVLSRLNPQRGCGCDLVESLSWKDSDWELTVGDLANLPYEDSLFDTVVASLVLCGSMSQSSGRRFASCHECHVRVGRWRLRSFIHISTEQAALH